MIHQNDFKNYKHPLLLFNAFKIVRSCAVYIFLFYLIYIPCRSQIYQSENITKGTRIISEKHLEDSGSSEIIFVLEGTTTTGLGENTKSKILVADLRYKHPKKNLKSAISKKNKIVVNSKAEEVNLKIAFKNASDNVKFILLTNNFLAAVGPSNTNCDKLLAVLKTNRVQFLIDFGGKIVAHQNSTSTRILSISHFHSIRPPPYFPNSHKRALGSKKAMTLRQQSI